MTSASDSITAATLADVRRGVVVTRHAEAELAVVGDDRDAQVEVGAERHHREDVGQLAAVDLERDGGDECEVAPGRRGQAGRCGDEQEEAAQGQRGERLADLLQVLLDRLDLPGIPVESLRGKIERWGIFPGPCRIVAAERSLHVRDEVLVLQKERDEHDRDQCNDHISKPAIDHNSRLTD